MCFELFSRNEEFSGMDHLMKLDVGHFSFFLVLFLSISFLYLFLFHSPSFFSLLDLLGKKKCSLVAFKSLRTNWMKLTHTDHCLEQLSQRDHRRRSNLLGSFLLLFLSRCFFLFPPLSLSLFGMASGFRSLLSK